jgi:hypothetical protein
MKEVGKNINQAARTSSVSWSRLFGVPKVLDNVVMYVLAAAVVSYSSCFLRRSSHPPPRARTQTAIWGVMYVQQGVFLLCILPRAVRLPGRKWKMFCEK